MSDLLCKLDDLSKSKFRNSFHLNKNMIDYVNDKGFDIIRKHAYDLVIKRLKNYDYKKDGKQTPMKQVHPVFIAEHACACCCRGCLEKWHHINKYKTLDNEDIDYIVNIIMLWIRNEMIVYEKKNN